MTIFSHTTIRLVIFIIIGFSFNLIHPQEGNAKTDNNSIISDDDAGFPEFITTWKTDDTEITIPTFGGESYLYNLTWTNLTNAGVGDGSKSNLTGDYTISGLANNDIYEIKISGAFPRIYFNNGGDKDKILTIENWGDQAWTSMASAFYGCSNLTVTDSDAPDLTNVIDMSSMFRGASSLNSDFNNWDVGTIENMSRLFQDATLFNGNIINWDVSQVKDMSDMFFFAENFNQDIGGWHTDNVTDMSGMFGVAKAFNQNINTDAFNGTWNTTSVTNMNQMLSVAESFNQPLSNWNVTNVTDFGGMFNGATVFNQNISTWTINTTLPVKMGAMFSNAIAFNQDIGGWNVSMVTDMGSMFAGATAFDQVLSSWQVGNVTTMNSMFSGTTYNQDITGWDVSNVSDFNGMFSGNPAFNQDISGWITSSAGDFRHMFSSATAFNQNLGNWDISNIFSNDMYNMLNNSGLTIENYDATLIGWESQLHNINVQLGASGLYYCAAESAHAALIGEGWLIYDEGQGCIAVFEGTDTSGPEVFNLQVNPVDFGSGGPTGKTKSITVNNQLAADITGFDVSITGTAFSVVSILPGVITSGVPLTIDIQLDGGSTGSFTETVTLSSNEFTSFSFQITGVITSSDQPEIKVFEGPNPFGTEIIDGDLANQYPIGYENRDTDATNQITILNNGSADLDVSDISFTGTAFSATPSTFPITIPVDGSQTIDITLSGTSGGDFTETMNIVNTDSDEDPFNFMVTGIIFGPELVVVDGTNFYTDPPIKNGQPTPLDIGSSALGTDLTYQISFTNDGPVDLTVTDISIPGTSFSHNASLPFTVPAVVDGVYSYVMFNITLDGTTAGTFAETVTITSDDDTDPTYSFDVTGNISDPNAPKVYWTNYDLNDVTAKEINRSNLDGSGFEQYHTESTYTPRGIAIDTLNNIIYWTNDWGQIRKGTIDVAGFTSIADFINDGIDLSRELNGVALDLTARKIYWVSTYDGAIKSADLDAGSPISTVQTIVSGLLNPIGIAVDPAGKIYYTDNDNNGGANDNTATLHQVNFDGSGDVILSTSLVASEQYTYRDIKLDMANNMIYWSGGNDDIYSPTGEIYYADISDVSGTVAFYNTLNNAPWGIDLDLTNGKIYWVDVLTYMVEPKIGRANLNGSNPELIQTGYDKGVVDPLFLALDAIAPTSFTILSHTPISNSQSIAANSNIVLNFDSNVEATTLNSSNILIKGEQSGIINGTFSGGGTTAIIFDPTNDLKIGDNIQVTLTTGIQNTGGNFLNDDYFFSFEVQTGPSPATPPLFMESTIYDDGTNTGVDRVVAIDMNLDGSLDVAAIYEGIDEGIAWYQNDGAETFTRQVAATPTMSSSRSIYAADLDQDGDIDLLGAHDGRLDWYENDGAFNFTEHFIYQTGVGFGLSDMRVVDMDGDGDLDVVGAYSTSVTDFIRWHENDGNQNFTSSPVIVAGINNPQGLEVADIDNDGDIDIFTGGSDDDIAWYENDGNQNFTSHVTTPTSMTSQYSGFTIGDFNGDGFVDMALNTTTQTSWFANDGSGNFTENQISTSVGGEDLEAADLDGDGDMDLVAGSSDLSFFENDGVGNFTRRITSTTTTIEDIFTVDLDSDGDLDVIAGGQGSKVVWFENSTISTCANPPTADAGADLAICETDVANLSGTIGGDATTLTWSTNGDGTFDDTTSLTAIYTPGANDIINGSVTLTLTTDDPDGTGPCTSTADDVVITFDQIPTVDAGVDQIICQSDVVNLNATFGGTATGATWSTSGDGTFDDASSLTAVYTPGSTDVSDGSITLTLSSISANCPVVTDDVLVEINQPITAINQSGGTLKVNETIVINALNGATINAGDVITTTVMVDPQKGNVTVNADGTIDYTANEGNVGSDSFDFQICNQCNLCSTATANITIENDAPDFSGTTTSATPGASVTVDIISLITDLNNNIDLSSIRIVEQPISGAVATLDGDHNLIVDYTGVIFFGTDEVVIEVCDFDGACTMANIQIEVEAQPIVAFNAVSPNGDGRHDFLEFEFIEGYPENEVKIFNRWGDVVFQMESYNNQDKIFNGKANKGTSKDLPTGTYFYSVAYQTVDNQSKTVKGYFELRR